MQRTSFACRGHIEVATLSAPTSSTIGDYAGSNLTLAYSEANNTSLSASSACSPSARAWQVYGHHPARGPQYGSCMCLRGQSAWFELRKRRRRSLPFASLAMSIDSRSRESRLQKTFKEIDKANKGFLNQADLEQYADSHNLPAAYVPHFLSAVEQRSVGDETTHDHHIGFDEFSRYVTGREFSLRRVFDRYDTNSNGFIDAQELAAGLSGVRVQGQPLCSKQRCVYRCRREAVQKMLDSVAKGQPHGMNFEQFREFFLLLPKDSMMVDYWITAKAATSCDIGGCVVIRDDASAGSPWGHLFAGAMAGAASRTVTAPLETVRLQAMTGTLVASGTLDAAQQVMRTSGWKALFRGNMTNVLRSAPQKALDFFAFDAFKDALSARGGAGSSGVATFAAAGLAGAASSALLYPLEVVRTRLTADTLGRYGGTLDALRKIMRYEGGGALYKGLAPSILAILPEAAITYGLFDTLKRSYCAATGKQEAGVLPALGFGVFSAFTGQLVAFPLETVARRLQVGCGPLPSPGFVAMLRRIVQAEGPLALYSGVGAASMRVVPMACVSFGTYELVRIWMLELEHARAQQRPGLRVRLAPATCPDPSTAILKVEDED